MVRRGCRSPGACASSARRYLGVGRLGGRVRRSRPSLGRRPCPEPADQGCRRPPPPACRPFGRRLARGWTDGRSSRGVRSADQRLIPPSRRRYELLTYGPPTPSGRPPAAAAPRRPRSPPRRSPSCGGRIGQGPASSAPGKIALPAQRSAGPARRGPGATAVAGGATRWQVGPAASRNSRARRSRRRARRRPRGGPGSAPGGRPPAGCTC